MTKALPTAILVAAIIALASGAGTSRAETGERELRRAVAEMVAAGVPGAVVLARSSDRTIRVAIGRGRLSPRQPIDAADRFRIGSLTKTYTATVILQLAAVGKLSLADSVERWLPGLVPNGESVTIRHLLNMRAGLFDYLNDGDQSVIAPYLKGSFSHVWTPRQLVRVAVSHKPHFRPGAGYRYCNTCYVLLGLIAENATGASLGNVMRRDLFRPLDLHRTTFATKSQIAGPHAHGYELLGKPPLVDVTLVSPSYGWAAGAIVSTADDVARFYRGLLAGHLLRPNLLRAMTKTIPFRRGESYGLGLHRFRTPCGDAWGHEGSAAGYEVWAYSSRNGERQILVLSNLGEDSFSTRARQALERVFLSGFCGSPRR